MSSRSQFIPLLSIIGATMLMASAGVFIKLAAVPAPLMSWFRTAVPLVALTIFYLLSGHRRLGKPSALILLGSFLNAVRLLLLFAGYLFTSVSNGIMILYSWPVFATLFGALFLKERIPLRNRFLLLLAFAGIGIVYSQSGFEIESRDFIGMSMLLISSALYSLTVIVFKAASVRYDQIATTFYQNLVPALLFTPALFFWPFPTGASLAYASLYAVLIGLVAFLLFFTALKHLPASVTAHLSYLEVFGALALSVLVLGETLSWNKLVGGAMILLSVLFVSRGNQNKGGEDQKTKADI